LTNPDALLITHNKKCQLWKFNHNFNEILKSRCAAVKPGNIVSLRRNPVNPFYIFIFSVLTCYALFALKGVMIKEASISENTHYAHAQFGSRSVYKNSATTEEIINQNKF